MVASAITELRGKSTKIKAEKYRASGASRRDKGIQSYAELHRFWCASLLYRFQIRH